ncbi:hypothetical protein ACX9VS_11795 (plasmid) [Weissella paramesenteroides]
MMSKIIKEKSIPFNLEQSKIILQEADVYYEKLSTELPNKATLAVKPKIFHTLYDMGNTTLIIITCSNTRTGSNHEPTVEQYLKLFDNALLNAINQFQLNSYDKNSNKPITNEETSPKKEPQNNYHYQKRHSPLLDKIMYELEDFAYMFPIMAFVIGGLGVYELFSEPFSFGTIRDVFIAGIFVYGLMKATHKIIDYNFIPAEDAARDTDSEVSENTDDLEAYIASELIREHNSEDKENF